MIELINESKSIRELLRKIKLDTNGSGNYRTLKNKIIELGIDYPEYNFFGSGGYKKRKNDDEVFIENSTLPRQKLKGRIIKNNIIEYKCSICSNEGNWMNKKLSLHLDHINGINNDNRIENLRFLCPNCHSQTEAYSGKKNKKIYNDTFENKNENECIICGKKIGKYSKMCVKCNHISQKKVKDIPSKEILLNEVNELGYRGTGRIYNVSDTTIRKWIKNIDL